jgi:hypothetical protein
MPEEPASRRHRRPSSPTPAQRQNAAVSLRPRSPARFPNFSHKFDGLPPRERHVRLAKMEEELPNPTHPVVTTHPARCSASPSSANGSILDKNFPASEITWKEGRSKACSLCGVADDWRAIVPCCSPAIAVRAAILLNVDRTRDCRTMVLFAEDDLESPENGTTGEATTRPLRADAELPLIKHGLGIDAVAD